MGKIVVSTFVTLDGIMESPEKWSFDFQSDDTLQDAVDLLFASDALLLGRTTYEGFAAAWPSREDPMGFADKMNAMPKYVVSTTLKRADWNNSTIIGEDVVERVRALKDAPGRSILIYGSATLMRSLLKHDLIDEYVFLLNPVIIGEGKRLFPDLTARKTLDLAGAKALGGGMVALRYRPTQAAATS